MDENLTYKIEGEAKKPEPQPASGIVVDKGEGEKEPEGPGSTTKGDNGKVEGMVGEVKKQGETGEIKLIPPENPTNPTDKALTKAEEERKRTKALFIEFYEKFFCLISRTCEKIGIDRTTYYEWRKTDAEFDKALKEAESREDEFVLNKLKEAVVNGDKPTIRFWASKKLPGFNTTKIETEITPQKSLKEVAEELEAMLNKEIDANKSDKDNNQQVHDGKLPDDPKQKGSDSAVQKQPGAGNILAKKDAPKHLAQAKTGGVEQGY